MTAIALAVALASSTLGLHGTWLRTGRRAVRAQPIVCRDDEPVVIIGSGIGGLSCACLLARYGRRVTVVESHEHAGGCAHSFERRTKEGTFVFDSGPSLWSGMSTPSVNPLRQVLDVVGESGAVEWKEYDGWGMLLPQGDFYFRTGDAASWAATLRRFGGPDVEAQWARLREACDPVTAAAGATPPMVLRSDAWVALPVLRCLGGILQAAPHAAKLNGPFSLVMDQVRVRVRARARVRVRVRVRVSLVMALLARHGPGAADRPIHQGVARLPCLRSLGSRR